MEELKKIVAALEEKGPSIAGQMQESIDLMETILRATEIKRDEVERFMTLSSQILCRVQVQSGGYQQMVLDAQQETVDTATAYKDQVSILRQHNSEMAEMIYRTGGLPIHSIEGQA